MKKYSLSEIKEEVERLAVKINAPFEYLPSFKNLAYYGDFISDDYVDVDKDGMMYYIVEERGKINSQVKTDNLDEILYYVFESITFHMAVYFECENRIENKSICR